MKTIEIKTKVVVTVTCDTFEEMNDARHKLFRAGWTTAGENVQWNRVGGERYVVTVSQERSFVGSEGAISDMAEDIETLLAEPGREKG